MIDADAGPLRSVSSGTQFLLTIFCGYLPLIACDLSICEVRRRPLAVVDRGKAGDDTECDVTAGGSERKSIRWFLV